MSGHAAIVGGGVIGGGWAARFLLAGWDVRVFDPDPEAARKIGEVLENARRSLPGLSDSPLPAEGVLQLCDTLEEAVAGAAWVQESVPERLELKHKVYAAIEAAVGPDVLIGSSTSGFTPSDLQAGAVEPGRIVVTHPFNPVYLLPLVELVASPASTPDQVARARAVIDGIGMYPLHIRQEIDAHLADRLLEAVWREALWLVSDGVATTAEIDDAIRYGFGIRWAQMGLFETYRIAGGEAGMKHFMAQFGPALKWPWTKLMDVPAFTDDLVDLIAGQSDAQSGHMGIRELERMRDDNLVAMMRALKPRDWGAGAILNAQDRAQGAAAGLPRTADAVTDPAAPVITVRRAVPVDWLDYNGHMTEARYLQAFADASDRFMEIIGCDQAYIASGGSFFTAETHIRHLDEARLAEVIELRTRVLGGGGKKMHLWHEIWCGTRLLATGEHVLIHVSLETRRPAPMPAQMAAVLDRFVTAQAGLPLPEGAGRFVGQPR
ncbi:MAG: carnitine 3-dehydrogenase [Marinibacterium sp.]|nr:carnitine 3-dehydrogenase [Marinibacterium sp.]